MSYRSVKNLVAAGAIIMVAGNTYAFSIDKVSPFIGAEGVFNSIKGRADFGKFFPHDYPAVNLYAGTRLNKNFGVELGWEATERKTKRYTSQVGEKVFDRVILAGDNITQIRMRNIHLDVNGYYPLTDRVELLGSVGVDIVKPKFNTSLFTTNYTVHSKSTGVLRLRAGAQYMANQRVGIRGLVGWANYANVKVDGLQKYIASTAPNRPFKNSIFGSLGLFVKF